jgi:hypothetical protein
MQIGRRIGRVVNILLPSIKMKSYSPRGRLFESELHSFLLTHFTGYTVTAGSITGYWKGTGAMEECNEHRQYEIAFNSFDKLSILEKYLAHLAWELGEKTIYLTTAGRAVLISAKRNAGAGRRRIAVSGRLLSSTK